MLTQVVANCAAALCATMSPASPAALVDAPIPVETVVSTPDMALAEEDPPASIRLGDADVEITTDAVVEEDTTVDTADAEDTAPTETALTDDNAIVMVSTPIIQPLDVEADIAALAIDLPPVTLPTPEDEEIDCLARNIYHEARGEPERGRYAVAWVTVNRMQSAQFPDTVCEVVYQKTQNSRTKRWVAQFSWTLQNPAPPQGASWADAQRIARTVYAQRNNRGGTQRLSSGVMYYHATRGVSRQNLNWFQRALNRVATIGDHIFYRER